jgi:predicted acyl esterase
MQPLKSEVRDGMRIDWDVPVTMDDGVVLRCDVYRPVAEGKYPVIMTSGPYAKWLAYQDGYATVWELFAKDHPDAIAGSSNKYQNWEVVDPEKWVADGYACVRVDSRGAGRSPGVMSIWSPREAKDYYNCIEWAGVAPWSNGKVGLNGISYYAMNQWQVACLQPPHLAAMCPWEGAADFYRDMSHHGGIFNSFCTNWFDTQVRIVQHGLGERGPKSSMNGELVCGPETLSPGELKSNMVEFGEESFSHPLDDAHWKAMSPDWSKVKVPFLSAASWGGQGLHPRGNYEAFMRAASKDKWLEAHGLEHWTHFYTPYGEGLQRKFFGKYLKGEDTGWEKQPRVLLQVRHVGEKFVERAETEWPLARTQWTKRYLDPKHLTLEAEAPASPGRVTYDGLGDGVTFFMPPSDKAMEITGPLAAKLFVSSETEDADLFLVVRLFSPDMREVTFSGTVDPHTPIAQGWLRASHRKLDPKLTQPYRPYHTHDEKQPLKPGEIVELDVEIWPTCIVVPPGYRLALTVRGKDYVYPGGNPRKLSNMKMAFTGCGPFLHDEPRDRPEKIFGGKVTLHVDPQRAPYLLLPVIP